MGRADLQARRGERSRRSASSPTARRTVSGAACRKRTCATRRRRRSTPRLRARSPRSARRREWNIDLAPYKLLEQSQQTRPGGRVDHVFVYERAEKLGDARIRLRLGVAGDELTEIAPYVYIPESFERRFRELRSANDTIAGFASVAAGIALRPRRLRPRRAVARAQALARRAAGAARRARRRRTAGRGDARRPRRPHGSASTPRNRRRRSGCGRSARRSPSRVGGGLGYALVFMTAESLDAPRVSRAPAALARLVERRGADARGAGTHARRLPVRADRARARRGVLLRDESLARLVAALRGADRSEHPVVRDAGADADRRVAAGGLHGGMPVPRGAARARRADRRALRTPQRRDRRSRSCCRRWSSAPRTRTTRAFRRIRGSSSSSCRR